MNPLNLLKLFEKWISERGSAAILRDHNALLKSQIAALESGISALNSEIESLKKEREFCKTKAENLQMQFDSAHKEIEKLNSVRIALKEQTQFQNRIAQLEAMNGDLERQLRIKNIGF